MRIIYVAGPFAGIGSEIYQAIKMGRRGYGIELKKSYFDVAVKNCLRAKDASEVENIFDREQTQ